MSDLPSIDRELAGKTSFVMGGSSGIGLASARLLARRGAAVTLFGHDQAALAEAGKLRAAGHRALGIQGDGAQSAAVEKAVADTVAQFGGLDILVHTCAIHPVGTAVETDEATFDRAMAVNVKSMYLLAHFGVPHLLKAGGGAIVNCASIQAVSCTPGVCAYATTKGANRAFTHTLAVDFGKSGIRANCVMPGTIRTPMVEHFAKLDPQGRPTEEIYKLWGAPVPLGRIGEAGELAELIAFLAGPRSSFCNGAEFTADGGLTAALRI